MKQIGFKNFRKFSEYTSFELGKLNILVGTNNSGKSSFIKACILAQMNINRIAWGKEIPIVDISFNNKLDAHIHLGDFRSNLSFLTESDEMELSIQANNTTARFVIDGSGIQSNDPSLLVPLKRLEFYDSTFDATLRYEFSRDAKTKLSLTFYSEMMLKILADVINDKHRMESLILAPPLYVIDRFENKYLYTNEDAIKKKYSGENRQIVFSWEPYEDLNLSYSGGRKPEPFDDCKELELLYKRICQNAQRNLSAAVPTYIEAHNAPHNEILFIEDRNCYLTQTVARFVSSKASRSKFRHGFIVKWMKEFHVGDDYSITSPYYDVLKVDILRDGKWSSLGTLGTGSIQLFILLLRLAIPEDGMILIEEPEQNLHPALQSKLADLFFEYTTFSKVQVFVETHSEYLVRRTQVIVSEKAQADGFNLENLNQDYKVYYFPEDSGAPYSMNYMSSGQFARNFGTGFYDEADKSFMALLKDL